MYSSGATREPQQADTTGPLLSDAGHNFVLSARLCSTFKAAYQSCRSEFSPAGEFRCFWTHTGLITGQYENSKATQMITN